MIALTELWANCAAIVRECDAYLAAEERKRHWEGDRDLQDLLALLELATRYDLHETKSFYIAEVFGRAKVRKIISSALGVTGQIRSYKLRLTCMLPPSTP